MPSLIGGPPTTVTGSLLALSAPSPLHAESTGAATPAAPRAAKSRSAWRRSSWDTCVPPQHAAPGLVIGLVARLAFYRLRPAEVKRRTRRRRHSAARPAPPARRPTAGLSVRSVPHRPARRGWHHRRS